MDITDEGNGAGSSSRHQNGAGRYPSPGRLNSLHDLVLDYVSQQAYASTAKVLSQPRPKRVTGDGVTSDGIGGSTTNGSSGHGGDDGGMDIDVTPGVGPGASSHPVNKDKEKERLITPSELESIERRRGILNHILNGAIMRAIDSIQTHFPAVLDETSLPKPPPQAQPTSYASYQGSSSTAPPRRLGQVRQPAQPMAHSIPVNVQSTHPAHVMLNLKIQAFIERFRNNASSSPSTPSSSIESLTSSMHMSTEMTGQSGPPTLNLGSSVNKTSKLAADLTAVQDLHAFAKNLPADDRAVYLPELQWINSLFAYTDPETSILRGFLEQDRRIALAEQVNAAILASEEKSGPAFLRSIAQRTAAIYTILNAKDIDPRPVSEDEKKSAELAGYWKQHANGRYRFSLHEFVDRSWA